MEGESKKRQIDNPDPQPPNKRVKTEENEHEEDIPSVLEKEEGGDEKLHDEKVLGTDVATSSAGRDPEGTQLSSYAPPGAGRGYYFMDEWRPVTHEEPLKVGTGTGLVYDERIPMRIKSIYSMLLDKKLAHRCTRVEAREATVDELRTVHSESYRQVVSAIKNLGEMPLKTMERMYDSIYLNKKSGLAARISAGSTVEIVKRVVEGKLRNGVAVVRPPGHHAERHASKGFCFFNNVAIAAKVATDKLGVNRVLILDWDIHHGNGTQHMFEDDKKVLYFSVHRYDHGSFYPGSSDGGPRKVGNKPAEGYNMNVGWNGGGLGDGDYIGLFHQLLLPVAYEFSPQLILISAGFDSARGDPLGGCDISPNGFAHMTHALMGLAQGKVVMVLEGGYNLSAISQSFAACTAVLLGDPPKMLGRVFPSKKALRAMMDTKRYHAPYWMCCTRSASYEQPQFTLPGVNGGLNDDEEEDKDYSGGEDEEEDDEDGEGEEEKQQENVLPSNQVEEEGAD
ncbi:hypothetical protein AAMO2058_001616900 [Amorphochlora amoebiformis]